MNGDSRVETGEDPVQTMQTMMTGYFWTPDADRSPAGDGRHRQMAHDHFADLGS